VSALAMHRLSFALLVAACGGAELATPPATTVHRPPPSPTERFVHDVHLRLRTECVDRFLASRTDDAGVAMVGMFATVSSEWPPMARSSARSSRRDEREPAFDEGVLDAVRRAQPSPTPPESIRSADGNAWLRWRFDRGAPQCGTWNATPFVIADALEITVSSPSPTAGP
jgi:hypothetical protein